MSKWAKLLDQIVRGTADANEKEVGTHLNVAQFREGIREPEQDGGE
jgi:hypothetical protein